MTPFNLQFRVTGLTAFEDAPSYPKYRVTLMSEQAYSLGDAVNSKSAQAKMAEPASPDMCFTLDVSQANFSQLKIGDIFELALQPLLKAKAEDGVAGMLAQLGAQTFNKR